MDELQKWGFFNGEHPHHEDVARYFTHENHLQMFGEAFEGTDLDLDELRNTAHNALHAYPGRD